MYSCGHMKQKHLLHQQSDVVLSTSGNTDRYGTSAGSYFKHKVRPNTYC